MPARGNAAAAIGNGAQTIVALKTMQVSHAEKNNHPVETALSV
jgi:hypothetical protein